MTELAKRKAELVLDDRGKPVSSKLGTYNDKVTVELVKYRKGKITTIRDITKVQYGRAGVQEKYVRRKVSTAVNMLLRSGIPAYPVYNEKGHHEVMGIKVVTEYNDDDIKKLTEYQQAAEDRGDLSREKVNLIKDAVKALKEKRSDKDRPMQQPEFD